MSEVEQIIETLRSLANDKNREGMAKFGIVTAAALGISVVKLRELAKPYKKNHGLALALWQAGIHEAQIMATIVDDPAQVTPEQMDSWIKDFDSWDVCDQACCNLFDKTPYAVAKIKEWSKREKEFEKRAGFALMAGLAWHSKTESDATFLSFLPLLSQAADDDRNFVKKAVNWALRQIGKRNETLRHAAIATASDLKQRGSESARWIGSDAVRELQKQNSN